MTKSMNLRAGTWLLAVLLACGDLATAQAPPRQRTINRTRPEAVQESGNRDEKGALERLRRADPDSGRRSRNVRTIARGTVARGTTINTLPQRAERLTIRHRDYFRSGDVFYTTITRGPSVVYEVARPPTGVYLSVIPESCTTVSVAGVRYYFNDDVYYLPTVYQDRHCYLVVDAPVGAVLAEPPYGGEWVQFGPERLYRFGPMYFRQVLRDGRMGYVRINYVRPQATTLYGTISYRGRLALPSDAVVQVQLLDVTRPDRAEVVAEQTLRDCGQAPIPYSFEYNAGRIRSSDRYALTATISTGGRLLYAAGSPQLIAVGGAAKECDLLLDPVRQAAPARMARVTGAITYRERMALPSNAEVVVRLIDSNSPFGAVTLAEQVFYPKGGVPIPFELRYNPADIDPLGIYVVDAMIRTQGATLFYNLEEYRVITRGYPDDVEIWVSAAG